MTNSIDPCLPRPRIFLPLAAILCALVGLPIAGIGISYFLGRMAPSTPAPSFPTQEMGSRNAKVIIEEFADYQCPHCGEFHANGEPRLRTKYIQTGKVRFLFRNYPVLDRGNTESGESHLAALGALCAGEQGKFWEYHDLLFENQSGENSGGFAVPRLLEFALELGLDGSRFSQCVETKRYKSVIENDFQLGQDRDLRGVPTFCIDGQAVVGFDPSKFFAVIDRALGEQTSRFAL